MTLRAFRYGGMPFLREGNKGYFEQLEMAGLEKPFAEGAVKRAVAGVLEELGIE